MIGMAWENTLLASRILPPAYTPVDVATNRSQDASLMLEQDGRLTLLIILTTAAGLAIVLLFFILLRIGCLRSNSCFGRYKDRHDRSPCLTTVVLDDRTSTKSLAVSQQTIQTTFVQTRSEIDPTSNYTIKLVDNDLIVETQGSFECGEPTSSTTPTGTKPANLSSDAANASQYQQQQQLHRPNNNQPSSADQSSLYLFKSWLMMMKSKGTGTEDGNVIEPLDGIQQMTPLETKSLCGSPGYRYGRTVNDRGEMLASQKQQILARFGQHLPGFGFSQSKSSCLFEDDDEDDVSNHPLSSTATQQGGYSYRNGNQLEYMGGPYGYVDPLYSHQLVDHQRQSSSSRLLAKMDGQNAGVRLSELDIVQHRQRCPSSGRETTGIGGARHEQQHQQQPPLLLLLPTFVRSAESLVVLSKEHRDAAVDVNSSADRRYISSSGSD